MEAWFELMLNQTIRINVATRRYWNCGAAWLEKEGSYTFDTTGSKRWVDFYRPAGADGYQRFLLKPFERCRRVPKRNGFALIGSIEKESAFFIGAKLENYRPRQTGRLFCFANDVPLASLDYRGGVRLMARFAKEVRLRRRPGFRVQRVAMTRSAEDALGNSDQSKATHPCRTRGRPAPRTGRGAKAPDDRRQGSGREKATGERNYAA
jgi:hypothetical protein